MKTHIIGKIRIKARHIPTSEIVETTIFFEDWEDKIFYCWSFHNGSAAPIGGKCSPIKKSIIDTDAFEYAINHSKYNIENYKDEGQKIFRVEEIQKL